MTVLSEAVSLLLKLHRFIGLEKEVFGIPPPQEEMKFLYMEILV